MRTKNDSILTEKHKEIISQNGNMTCYELGNLLGIKYTSINNYRQFLKLKEKKLQNIFLVVDRCPITGHLLREKKPYCET